MWELIMCVAVAWGGCVERPPVVFAGQVFCERARDQIIKRPEVRQIYCRPRK